MFAWPAISTSVTEAVLVLDSVVEFIGLCVEICFLSDILVGYGKLAAAGERKAQVHEVGG